jgi:hypothetical protein
MEIQQIKENSLPGVGLFNGFTPFVSFELKIKFIKNTEDQEERKTVIFQLDERFKEN